MDTMTWDFIIRLLSAGLLGGLIGLERELRAKEAGVRTHFIVALGSALFMIISQYAFEGSYDHSRVAAQVVSGIGFIGAGVIIFQKNAVRGITTAAGLWVAAAIGLACGASMFLVAAAAALLTIICLEAMHLVNRKYGERIFTVSISTVDPEGMSSILEKLGNEGFKIDSFSLSEGKAVLMVHSTHKDYLRNAEKVLSLLKEYSIEIY